MNQSVPLHDLLTFGIPVRIDNEERKANLRAVAGHLGALGCRIIVLEADKQPKADDISHMNSVDYHFVEDAKPVFHRTHYINRLLDMARTETVGIWDTDVLVDYTQIIEALQLVQQGATLACPYDGRFMMLSEHLSAQIRLNLDFDYLRNLRMKPFLGRSQCGGAYLVHKERYLQCGGENERFTGWGPEDAERLHRVNILMHRACHISRGELFHLYHPRTNSGYQSPEDARRLQEEFVKVCCMTADELKTYIAE